MASYVDASDVGFLQLTAPSATTCQLHPVVMFQVLDHHTRRNAEEGRVVGALLGSVGSDGTVQLKNAFPMNHDDVIRSPQNQEFFQHFNMMAELHARVNSREQVLGWYSTTKSTDAGGKQEVTEEDLALHSFFEDKIGDKFECILLRVDCNIQRTTKMGISAYVTSNMSLRQNKEAEPQVLGKCFARVPCNIRSYEAERIGVDFITHNSIGTGGVFVGSDLEKLQNSIITLTEMLDKTIEYIDDVESGKVPADSRVGRQLMEAVAAVPDVSPAEFEASLNKGLNDLLMVHYLGSLTHSQISFWQRMQTMV